MDLAGITFSDFEVLIRNDITSKFNMGQVQFLVKNRLSTKILELKIPTNNSALKVLLC